MVYTYPPQLHAVSSCATLEGRNACPYALLHASTETCLAADAVMHFACWQIQRVSATESACINMHV